MLAYGVDGFAVAEFDVTPWPEVLTATTRKLYAEPLTMGSVYDVAIVVASRTSDFPVIVSYNMYELAKGTEPHRTVTDDAVEIATVVAFGTTAIAEIAMHEITQRRFVIFI
jgi:hypothetical protein